MPAIVITDGSVFVNGVDMSDQCEAVTVTYTVDLKDTTTFGLGGRRRKGGLKDWSMKMDFIQNFDAAKVDATLFPLVGTADVPVRVRYSKTLPISATNPEYQGNGMLGEY